ncbi:MAG: 3-oxoacyl-ACP synthase [Planctomyces sp.]|nr:3-oxoacyl-ACP synthase [Planctomyces sp.]MBA4119558.1 3-oxoacyl-ACP synthase [Isosphaera sp.]
MRAMADRAQRALPPIPTRGVRIIGSGSALPSRILTNEDLASVVQTSDEWIVQRTGVRTRHVCDPRKGETNTALCTEALRRALAAAHTPASELDLVICGTITQDCRCPGTACLVAGALGAGQAAGWDLGAACCGFLYSLNTAHDLIRVGTHRTIGVIGCDTVSNIVDYRNRGVCILFGDAAGAVVLRATDDTSLGCLAQVNKADGRSWRDLYIPADESWIGPDQDRSVIRPGTLQMNGREVYRFAVTTFQGLIAETLDKAGLAVEDVDMYVSHQSNARILESARERFGIPEDKLYINIDRVGNSSAGSVPLCFDELVRAGRIKPGMLVMFIAFGAGLTWSSSLWRL